MAKLRFSNIILSFQSIGITDTSLWKYCYEYFVMAALIYFFPERYYNLMHFDKPDLIIGSEIGIEVTQCLNNSYNKSIGEWTNYRMGKPGKTKERCSRIIEKEGGELTDFGLMHRLQDKESQLIPVKNGIDSKMSKLPSYIDRFKECELAIILEEPLPEVIDLAIEFFTEKQNEKEPKFDRLIVLSNTSLVIFDYEYKETNIFTITKEENILLQNASIMIVNKKIKDIKECFVID